MAVDMVRTKINERDYLIQEQHRAHTQDRISLKMMEKNEIHGLLSFKNVQQGEERYYRYALRSGEMLSEWLVRQHTKKQVTGMIEDLLITAAMLEEYLLPQMQLCTEPELVSVYKSRCEFVYLPEDEYAWDGMFALIRYIIFQVKYVTDEEFSYLFDLQNAFSRGDIKTLSDIKKWLGIVNGVESMEREDFESISEMRMTQEKISAQTKAESLFADGVSELGNTATELKNAEPSFGSTMPDIINDLNRSDQTILIQEGQGDILVRTRTGEEYGLSRASCILGSGVQADITIQDNKTISRQHARLFLNGGFYFIEDMGSTNGTTVNGELLREREPYKLENMSRIMLSDEEFIYETEK